MKFLVIPSNRADCIKEFFAAWEGRGGWDKVIVVEDRAERSFNVPADYHFSHRDIDAILGPDSWIISREDSAIRAFGFLAAYHLGAEYVLTLDDDTRPHNWPGTRTLFDDHIDVLERTARWNTTVPGLRVRGLPYENVGRRDDVAISVGLWTGVPDLDGKTQLEQGIPPDFTPPPGKRLLAHGEYAPLCGMNQCFARRALPLAYFPLMGKGQPYRRFDDIFMGVIAKKLSDHLGWKISVGRPFVEHIRASDPKENARKEAPGIEANEHFWEHVDQVVMTEKQPLLCVAELGAKLQKSNVEYISKLGKCLRIWASLFAEKINIMA